MPWLGTYFSSKSNSVGKHLIWPMVSGTVYVIDTKKEAWDQNAIVSVNDLDRRRNLDSKFIFLRSQPSLYAHHERNHLYW